MPGAARRNRKFIGANRVTVFKENRDRNVRLLLRRIENAARLVTGHLGGRTVALRRDISLWDCPYRLPD